MFRINRIARDLCKDIDITIRHRPFHLYPEIPPSGINKEVFRSKTRKGIYAALKEEAALEKLELNYRLIQTIPNTLEAHRLIQLTLRNEVKNKMACSIFKAHFAEGKDIGDRQVLSEIGKKHGLTNDILYAFIKSDDGFQKLQSDIDQIRDQFISTVPALKISELILPGLQSEEVWENYIRRAKRLTRTQTN